MRAMRARGEERKRLRWWWGGYRFIRANAASAARGVTEEEQGQSGGGEFIHCTAPGVGVMRVYGVFYYTKTKDESDERERERRERWGGEERISGPIYGSVARGCRGQGADAERSVSLFLTHARVHTRRSSLVDTVITLD